MGSKDGWAMRHCRWLQVRLSKRYSVCSDAAFGPLRPGDVGIVIRIDSSKKPVLVSIESSASGAAAAATLSARTWWYAAAALVHVGAASTIADSAESCQPASSEAEPEAEGVEECAEEMDAAGASAARRGLDSLLRAASILERMAAGLPMPAWFAGWLRREEALEEHEAKWIWGTYEPQCITVTNQAATPSLPPNLFIISVWARFH